MSETSIVGLILALIGILKGKDIWEFFKHRSEIKGKTNDKIIEVYEKQLNNCEDKLKNAENKYRLKFKPRVIYGVFCDLW